MSISRTYGAQYFLEKYCIEIFVFKINIFGKKVCRYVGKNKSEFGLSEKSVLEKKVCRKNVFEKMSFSTMHSIMARFSFRLRNSFSRYSRECKFINLLQRDRRNIRIDAFSKFYAISSGLLLF